VNVSWRDDQFASRISGKAGLHLWSPKKPKASAPAENWQKLPTASLTSDAPIPRPDFRAQGLISLNYGAKTDLRQVTKNEKLIELIVDNRFYASEADFISTVKKAAVKASVPASEVDAVARDAKVVVDDVKG
jgi:hypothetical protein